MPSARSLPDATLGVTISNFSGFHRNSVVFQVSPRLTAAFRYSNLKGYFGNNEDNYDRSVDVQYRLLDEGTFRPAVAVGLRDVGGTGLLSSEYVVASKAFGSRIDASVGLGWGRLGTNNSFRNPLAVFGDGFNTRDTDFGLGGTFSTDQWFRGPAAVFAGVNWQATDKLAISVEYSSDDYRAEVAAGVLEYNSPFSFGVQYRLNNTVTLGGNYLYGSTFGATATFLLNPKSPPNGGSFAGAPAPVLVRSGDVASWGAGGVLSDADSATLRAGLAAAMAEAGIVLQGLDISGQTVRVLIANPTFDVEPQAIGRTARILTYGMPPGVEVFEIIPVVNGLRTARIILQRSDIEKLENAPDGAALLYAASQVEDAAASVGVSPVQPASRFEWGLAPYVNTSFFDPDQPLRVDVGAELSANYTVAPGLLLSGAAQLRFFGNIGDTGRGPNSVLPQVRTGAAQYAREGGSGIPYLTLDYFVRPGTNLYGRVTVGYLESMFGGASTELLWKPVDSRLALGVEVNYARQRDFDRLFGFQDYGVVTGHASAYYAFRNGVEGSVDIGRYLAGDIGATVSLARTFGNGWRIGAFATKTNVSAEDFGEGSFDKGITLSVPLSWFSGQPSRRTLSTTIRPITRDGGARLDVRNRLYGLVTEYHETELEDEWGQFWR